MSDRYFSDEPIRGERVVLGGAEAHHLIHVMRAQPGVRVALFDGSGVEFAAAVERVGRADVELAVLARVEVDRELPQQVTLGVALPKGDRQKWLVEKAVELGVSRIVPLQTARSVAQPVRNALDRLRRTVVEASKQCGRNRLLEIVAPQDWADFVAASGAAPCRLLAHPRATTEGNTSDDWSGRCTATPDPVLLAVGPEGGFATEEVDLAVASGWQTVDLGPRILRVETAALLLVAMSIYPQKSSATAPDPSRAVSARTNRGDTPRL
jgi:16S rRNA (uracil1498-N3)-methyltransferase